MGDSQNPFGTTVLLGPDFMVGAIIIWSGLVSAIPAHWQLCDGTNGTPDLRTRFVLGANNDGEVGATGGSDSHSHNFTGDGHEHLLSDTPGTQVQSGTGYQRGTNDKEAVGTTDISSHVPRFYALAYIQRMSQ